MSRLHKDAGGKMSPGLAEAVKSLSQPPCPPPPLESLPGGPLLVHREPREVRRRSPETLIRHAPMSHCPGCPQRGFVA